MDDFISIMKIGSGVLISLVMNGGVLFGLSSWLGKVWANRILEKEKAKFATELSKLQSQISIDHLSLQTALNVFSSGNNIIHEKKINAIQNLWEGFLLVRSNVPGFIPILDAASTDDEYDKILKTNFAQNELQKLTVESLLNNIINPTAHLEKTRLLVGEYLWSLFYSYRAIIGRFYILFNQVRSPKIPWYKDVVSLDMIQKFFNEKNPEDFEKFQQKIGGHYIFLTTTFERLFLEESRKIMSGEAASHQSLHQSYELRLAAEKMVVEVKDSFSYK